MCRAYTSAITAWLQNVYEPANNSAAPTAARIEPDNSTPTRVRTPQAIAASTAETRFSAWAGSPPIPCTSVPAMAKYSGYPSRAETIADPATVWNDAVSPKSSPGRSVDR